MKFIPGFRSGKVWKMIIAILYYLFCFLAYPIFGIFGVLLLLSIPFAFFGIIGAIRRRSLGHLLMGLGAALLLVVSSTQLPAPKTPPIVNTLLNPEPTATPAPTPSPIPKPTPTPAPELEAHFIDVGQADSALLISDGHSMLIDGGNEDDGGLIYTYLNKHHINRLDYVIGTHAHEDHMGGLSGALKKVKVGVVYAPETETDEEFYQTFKNKIDSMGLEIKHPNSGTTFRLGTCSVRLFCPTTEDEDELNNTSIVTKVICGDTVFLFAGDAEKTEEDDIIEQGFDLSADVLKVGNHGSDKATTEVFLNEVAPDYAIISVGKDNPYGHPNEPTMERLRDADVQVYRTDMQGDIIVESDGEDITVSTAKNEDIETNPTAEVTKEEKPEEKQEPEEKKETEEKQEPVDDKTVKSVKYARVGSFGYVDVHSEPNWTSDVAFTVPFDNAVGYIADAGSGFVRVEYSGSYGYVESSYLSDNPPPRNVSKVLYVSDTAPICAAPAQNATVLSYAPAWDAIGYIEDRGAFYRIEHNGTYGYVSTSVITDSKPAPVGMSSGGVSGGDASSGGGSSYGFRDSSRDTVYYTATGRKYHSRKGCRTLWRSKNIYSTTREKAKNMGLEPCEVCN